eukprot:TRINITY_DN40636_c0_g1_i1.p1 TRINITY_DN40636_c0_g1~~TRINITY_DN40636_c0_g1_i1.p1  ORF type:complete len:174 (+),score=23.01 TRINITY_DN40636_c0_g1_i1:56-577(+)
MRSTLLAPPAPGRSGPAPPEPTRFGGCRRRGPVASPSRNRLPGGNTHAVEQDVAAGRPQAAFDPWGRSSDAYGSVSPVSPRRVARRCRRRVPTAGAAATCFEQDDARPQCGPDSGGWEPRGGWSAASSLPREVWGTAPHMDPAERWPVHCPGRRRTPGPVSPRRYWSARPSAG